MIEENICIGAAFAGCIIIAASAVLLSTWIFVLGFGLMMGSMAVIA